MKTACRCCSRCAAWRCFLVSQPAAARAGRPAAGRRLPAEQRLALSPAGRQVPLDTFPMSSALSPDGKYLLVLNGGYNPPSISVSGSTRCEETEPHAGAGRLAGADVLAERQDGLCRRRIARAVFEFTFADGKLAAGAHLHHRSEKPSEPPDFIGDVALSPDGRMIYAAGLYHDAIHRDQSAIGPRHRAVQDRPAAVPHSVPP